MLFTLLSLTIAAATVQAAEVPRPNVLFIAIDDLKPALGCYGDGAAVTPNLDRLAERAVRFDRAYCNQAVCSPSRNALMTSLRPQTLGIYDLSTNFRVARPQAVTMAQFFKEHGYRTSAIGKILHTGHGNHDDADSWTDKPLHPKGAGYALAENDAPAGPGDQRGAPVEHADVPDEAYADGLIAAEAVKKIEQAKGSTQPTFLAVGFLRPHLPFVAPQKYWDGIDPAKLQLAATSTLPTGSLDAARPSTDELRKYKGVPPGRAILSEAEQRDLRRGYYAAVSYVDACVGRVLAALEASGLAERTIVVVWGDHGFHLGDHGLWGKHTNFEVAARIPLLVAAPKQAGAVSPALVETVDIFPTLSELAGLPQPAGVDGRSFANVLRDSQSSHRPHVTHVFPRGELLGRAVRDDRFRLVEWNRIGGAGKDAVCELFDYQTDPAEHQNLAGREPATVARMKALLAEQPAPQPSVSAEKSVAPAGKDRAQQFRRRDINHDGAMSREEFLLGQREPATAPERFRKLDKNGDGQLTEAEYVGTPRPAAAKADE